MVKNPNYDNVMWALGQVIAIALSISLSINYGPAAGVTTGYIILVLVDIRRELAEVNRNWSKL